MILICLSETFLNDTIENSKINIPNYHSPGRKDRTRHGGGVAEYAKYNLKIKRWNDLDHEDLDVVWVEVYNGHHTILLGTFNRPPSAGSTSWDLIHKSIDNASKKVNANL